MDNDLDLLLHNFSQILRKIVTLHKVHLMLHYKNIGEFILKKLICIILLTLTYSFPSAAKLDGKRLICECKSKCPSKNLRVFAFFNYRGIIFKNNEVIENHFWDYTDSFELEGNNYNYKEDLDFIKWGDHNNRRTLNRENLILTTKTKKVEGGLLVRQCSLYEKLSDYNKKMDQIKKSLQSKINKKIRKNKI